MASGSRITIFRALLLLLAGASVSLIYLLFSLDNLQITLQHQEGNSYPGAQSTSHDRMSKQVISKEFSQAEATLHLPESQVASQKEAKAAVNVASLQSSLNYFANKEEGARWPIFKDSISNGKKHQGKLVEHCNCSHESTATNLGANNLNRKNARSVVMGEYSHNDKNNKKGLHVNFYASHPVQHGNQFQNDDDNAKVVSHFDGNDKFILSKMKLNEKISKVSRDLEYILALLIKIKHELNSSNWDTLQAKNNTHREIKASIHVVEKLIDSISSLEEEKLEDDGHKNKKNIYTHQTNKLFYQTETEIKLDLKKTLSKESKDIKLCSEYFKGTLFGYPFYEKGFVVEKCPEEQPLDKMLSIVFNFVDYPSYLMADAVRLVKNVQKLHPQLPILMAIPKTESDHFIGINVKLCQEIDVDALPASATIWNDLINKVTTPLIFIGRKLLHFTTDASLERLVRAIAALTSSPSSTTSFSDRVVGIVGGATRTIDGWWSMDCYQTVLRNYTLVYRSGYHSSTQECLHCNYIQGPFVAWTSLLKNHPLDHNMPSSMLFEDYFLSLMESGIGVTVCPDAMFHVTFSDSSVSQKRTWTSIASKWRLNHIKTTNGHVHIFSCADIHMDCTFTTGLAVPPCCLELLSKQIKFIMQLCQEHHIICELQEGTLLGAIKLGKVLPWERDGDITFLSSNFSSIANLKAVFSKGGYTITESSPTRCCVEDRLAGGIFTVTGNGLYSPWTIEMYGYHKTDSEALLIEGIQPTRVFFDGMWVTVPRNPGKHLRNRYGHEIYKHAQHWISLGKYNGWDEYFPTGFTKCPIPGRHDCLDAFSVDGNLQFQSVAP